MKVIHVIGPVGVGKTHFINRTFPQDLTAFDIKIVYEVNQFEPSDLQGNEQVYQQFMSSLNSLFKHYVENMLKQGFEIGLCESSGINATMNSMLRKHEEYRIWIKPDRSRMDSTYLRERPYAEDLNKHIMKRFVKGEIYFNNIFDPRTDEYESNIPKKFQNIFKK